VLTIRFVSRAAIMFPPPPHGLGRCWSISASIVPALGQGLEMQNNADSASGGARAKRSWPATLLVFLFAYLKPHRWHGRYSHINRGRAELLAALVALALFIPRRFPGIARMSLGRIRLAGFALIVYLSNTQWFLNLRCC